MQKQAFWDDYWLEIDENSRLVLLLFLLFFWVLFNSSFIYFYLGPKFIERLNRFKIIFLNSVSAIISAYFVSDLPTPSPDCNLSFKDWKSATNIPALLRKVVTRSLDELFKSSWSSLSKYITIWLILFSILSIVFSFVFYRSFDNKERKEIALGSVLLSVITICILQFSVSYLCS